MTLKQRLQEILERVGNHATYHKVGECNCLTREEALTAILEAFKERVPKAKIISKGFDDHYNQDRKNGYNSYRAELMKIMEGDNEV